MFSLCEATRWNHLPVAGGWYDQHPLFVDACNQMMRWKSSYERQKEAKKDKLQGKTPNVNVKG